ncbi:glycosyltransferase [Prolixibacteraceae bacterium JC049]|nr:glycosyltransferase [Prolixibacteraceae bacterium JC049]
MRVLYIVNGFPSPENSNHGIFNFRAVKGTSEYVCPTIVKLRYWKPGRKIKSTYEYNGFVVTSFCVFNFPTNIKLIKALLLLISLWVAKMKLKKEVDNCDLIHSVGIDLASVIAASLSEKYEKKHIAQCIGTDLTFNLPLIEKYPWVRKWSKFTNMVLCNSSYLQKEVRNKYVDIQTAVAYRGANLTVFNSECSISSQSNKLTFLYLGGFADRSSTSYGRDFKGGVTLLKAWRDAIKLNSLRDGVLLLSGPESNTEFVNSLLDDYDIINSVTTIGPVLPDKVPELMRRADVIIIPSHSEGLPNVGVEALASHNVVIGSSVGGIPEVIIDGNNGFLFRAGDYKQLCFQIEKTLNLNDKELLDKKNLSRRRAEQFFDSKNYASSLVKLYNEITT